MTSPFLARWGVSLVAFGVLLCITVLYFSAHPLYLALSAISDGAVRHFPFGDLAAILQAGKCWGQGVNVYAPNSCMGGGEFNYSPLMLHVFWLLHLQPSWSFLCGLALGGVYCVALGWLPPAGSWRELALRLASAISPASYFAIEQANIDVFLFVMLTGAVWLLSRSLAWRMGGYGLILTGFLLKFYPVAMLPLAMREKRSHFSAGAAVSLCVGTLFLAYFYHGIVAAIATLPISDPFINTFGAINLSSGLLTLYAGSGHATPQWLAYNIPWFNVPHAIWVPQPDIRLCQDACIVAWAMLTWRRGQIPLAELNSGEPLFLEASALLISVCFLLASNLSYRAIYLSLAVPGLWRLRKTYRPAYGLLAILVFELWEAPIRDFFQALDHVLHAGPGPALLFWLAREVLWWWLAAGLLRIVLAFAILHLGRLLAGKIDAIKLEA
ncbi:MAG: hypothetical protein KGQ79_01585 [Proteobacteria bacterium]|nr:hypothetical protein [Pseudomonadota bacterium]